MAESTSQRPPLAARPGRPADRNLGWTSGGGGTIDADGRAARRQKALAAGAVGLTVASVMFVGACVVLWSSSGALASMHDASNARASDVAVLDTNCTRVPLEVAWPEIRAYSGVETCGNLYLQPDLSTPPHVRYAEASSRSLYTFLMLDQVGVLNGTWPLTDAPFPGDCCGVKGNPAPIRHWLVGNIPGSSLRTGLVPGDPATCARAAPMCAGMTVTPYLQPGHVGLPYGSHPYGHFLFKQPRNAPLAFPAFDDAVVTNRFHWDFGAFLRGYRLLPKVASNWMVVYHAAPGGHY